MKRSAPIQRFGTAGHATKATVTLSTTGEAVDDVVINVGNSVHAIVKVF